MNAIMKAIATGAIAILWNKKTLKWVVRYGNEALAKKIDISGKEKYAEILTDALDEIKLRGECVRDDGKVSAEENEKIIAFDEALVDKYWKED